MIAMIRMCQKKRSLAPNLVSLYCYVCIIKLKGRTFSNNWRPNEITCVV